jgi:transcriptional accessory protein Tex/SPT6
MPMARHLLRPPLFELWNLVPEMTAAVKQGKNTLSTFVLASKIETHIWSCVNQVGRFEKTNII